MTTSSSPAPVGGIQSLVSSVLDSIRERLSADAVDVFTYDAGSRHLVTVAWSGSTVAGTRGYRFPAAGSLAGKVAKQRTAETIDNAGAGDIASPRLRGTGLRCLAAVPLEDAEDEPVGVLQAARENGSFSRSELDELRRYGADVAGIIRARLAEDDRTAASALQRSLLPSRLPKIEGLDLSARFVPGEGWVSGDWYDVFVLPSGSVGVVMGDVAGHGLRASVVMGRLKSALRAYALEYDDPAEVLSRLDVKIQHFEAGAMATALYAVTRPPFDKVAIACAGHPQPLLARPSEATFQVEIICDLPLGVDSSRPRETSVVELKDEESLVFFTDGLVERRRTTSPRAAEVFGGIDEAIAELARVADADQANPLCGRILDHMLTIEPPEDDVALLVLRRDSTRLA